MKESTATRLVGRMPYEAPGLRLVPVAGVSTQLTVSGSTTTADFGNENTGDWGFVNIDGSTTTADFGNENTGDWGFVHIDGCSTTTNFGNTHIGDWGLSSDHGSTPDFTERVGEW